jgi:hypothetical protein
MLQGVHRGFSQDFTASHVRRGFPSLSWSIAITALYALALRHIGNNRMNNSRKTPSFLAPKKKERRLEKGDSIVIDLIFLILI